MPKIRIPHAHRQDPQRGDGVRCCLRGVTPFVLESGRARGDEVPFCCNGARRHRVLGAPLPLPLQTVCNNRGTMITPTPQNCCRRVGSA